MQRAVRWVDVRWNSWGPRAPVLGVAVLEMFIGKVTGELGKGVRRGLRGATDWTQRADAAMVAELSTPTGRGPGRPWPAPCCWPIRTSSTPRSR